MRSASRLHFILSVLTTSPLAEILEDPIVFNAVTRSSNRNNGVTYVPSSFPSFCSFPSLLSLTLSALARRPFSPIEIFTQIFEGGKMNESVAAALQESIAEAGGSSALQKMRAGLANPTILTAVQEVRLNCFLSSTLPLALPWLTARLPQLLQSAVLAQRGFNLLPANFTLWRHQGGTTVRSVSLSPPLSSRLVPSRLKQQLICTSTDRPVLHEVLQGPPRPSRVHDGDVRNNGEDRTARLP